MEKKTCTMCKQSLDITKFHTHKARSDGYASNCRDCEKTRKKKYRKKPEKTQEVLQTFKYSCQMCRYGTNEAMKFDRHTHSLKHTNLQNQ